MPGAAGSGGGASSPEGYLNDALQSQISKLVQERTQEKLKRKQVERQLCEMENKLAAMEMEAGKKVNDDQVFTRKKRPNSSMTSASSEALGAPAPNPILALFTQNDAALWMAVDSLLDLYQAKRWSSDYSVKDPARVRMGEVADLVRKTTGTVASIGEVVKELGASFTTRCKITLYKTPAGNPVIIKERRKVDALEYRGSVQFMNEVEFLRKAAVADKGRKAPPGIVQMYQSFQDEQSLYLVMDFYPGGDLVSLLCKRRISENDTKLYIAQMVEAIRYIHSLGYAHLDLSMENFVLDAKGHVFICDFDSCMPVTKEGTMLPDAPTPEQPVKNIEYMAPEFIQAFLYNKRDYGVQCDWWTLGILLFEFLYDMRPFDDEDDNLLQIIRKIDEFDKKGEALHLPDHPQETRDGKHVTISDDAKDLMTRLVCPRATRLNGPEILQHKWLDGIDPKELKNARMPFTPELSGKLDTTFFTEEEEDDNDEDVDHSALTRSNSGRLTATTVSKSVAFVGFSSVVRKINDDATEALTKEGRRTSMGMKSRRRSLDVKKTAPRSTVLPPKAKSPLGYTVEPVAALAGSVKKTKKNVAFPPSVLYMEAVVRSDLAAMEKAIASGIDVNAERRSKGESALHVAADLGNLPMVEALVEKHKMQVDTIDDVFGCTPLHFALLGDPYTQAHRSIAIYLMDHGASLTQVTFEDETAIDICEDDSLLPKMQERLKVEEGRLDDVT